MAVELSAGSERDAGPAEKEDRASIRPGACRASGKSDAARRPSSTRRVSRTFNVRRRSEYLSQYSEDMDGGSSHVVLFNGDEAHLLRGVRLSLVMRCAAALLQNRTESTDTYACSEEVKKIDVFLSHNWVVPRTQKFLCLVLHFNLAFAVLAGGIALVCLAAAARSGFSLLEASTTPVTYEGQGMDILHGWSCTLLTTPVVLVAAAWGQELRRFLGLRSCWVFLDKTCIHQTDVELQRQGIRKLGAFLRSSSRMVVLYTDVYLMKLWTVYEMACFLSLHPTDHLVVIPTYQPVVIFGMVSISYGTNLSLILLSNYKQLGIFTRGVVSILGSVALALLFRRLAREKEAMHKRLAVFQVQQCSCFDEADRPFVYQAISSLMRALNKVDVEATEEDALKEFNNIVCLRLSTFLKASIGRCGLSYHHVAVACLIYQAPFGIDTRLLGTFPPDWIWVTRYRLCLTAYYALWALGCYPLAIGSLSIWCGRCLHLRRVKELVFLLTGALSILMSFFIADIYIWQLTMAAVREGLYRDICTVGLCTLLIVAVVLTVGLYSGCRNSWVSQEAEPASEEAQDESKPAAEREPPAAEVVSLPEWQEVAVEM